ncbi:MAG: hypothetical protein CMA88_02590 [Euryarchaeota archaeon]|nr:hypothetical protein [Euryarchaeota archaeon]
MAQRSEAVSVALLLLPNIFLISFRIFSPELNEALSNDTTSEIVTHTVAIIFGLFFMWRYRFIDDHEHRRSKAIDDLSRTYKLEDKGLWDKGDVAIQKLEARAYADFKGRKGNIAMKRMQSSIGELNRESPEVEQSPEKSDYSIRVDGIEQNPNPPETEHKQKKGIFSRISEFIEDSIESSASRRVERRKKRESVTIKDEFSFPELDAQSQWVVPDQTENRKKARYCSKCSTYNEAEANYCASCGSFLD